jgi:hypothetical protein
VNSNETLRLAKVSDLSDNRVWQSLDTISKRLSSIESQLTEVVRVEERVNYHDKMLSSYGKTLERHEGRIQDSELWQANCGDRTSVEGTVKDIRLEVVSLRDKISSLEAIKDVSSGQKDVGKEILKWTVGILGTIIVLSYKSTL